MLDMGCENVKQLWKKRYPVEKLGWSVQAPVKQLDEGRQSISLEHVVPVFSQTTKYVNYFDHILKHPANVLELILMAN